jgi:hypothetical protein
MTRIPFVAALLVAAILLVDPYRLGDVRAALIEGPSLEALELVEVAC